MLTLAIDTSTVPASVALGSGSVQIAARSLEASATRSETVLPAIDEMLAEAGETASAVGAVVVGSGPGSFTGVRIGASLAKGLCYALDRPLYAFSSLAAAAVESGLEGRVFVLLDARGEQVYAAGYELGKDCLRELVQPCADSVSVVIGRIPGGPGAWTFVGTGSQAHRGWLERQGCGVASGAAAIPTASALLSLFDWHPDDGLVHDVRSWEPRYVRLPQAERETP
ncbi:MAG: tRNA (adenosine(37)-N6)-threonylcarbamoyltransferase complex dimerization subunit type 1 TsaB [Gemmatimonadota bacterium]